jgi:hypothetical protein
MDPWLLIAACSMPVLALPPTDADGRPYVVRRRVGHIGFEIRDIARRYGVKMRRMALSTCGASICCQTSPDTTRCDIAVTHCDSPNCAQPL